MQLTVPQRNVADTQSFPVDPDEVSRWLAGLQAVDNNSHAWEVYRGLKHSNRLHNDIDRRRMVISCFIPVLRELHNSLADLCRAQPMPLTREFRRSAKLLDGLLREEAFAFKLLLADSETPLADDVRRAMMALSRQADARVSGYQPLPAKLLRDANQLYQLAEHHHLLETRSNNDQPAAAVHHYFYIQWLATTEIQQIRARQMPLVLRFLRDKALLATPLSASKPATLNNSDRALHLHLGAKPTLAAFLLKTDDALTRWFSIATLLEQIDLEIAKGRPNRFSLPGADALEKQTLIRLRTALTQSRSRRSARRIVNRECDATLGHKAICAHFNFTSTEQLPAASLALQQSASDTWVQCNQSAQGSLLKHAQCSSGLAQVGELVCLNEQTEPTAATARVGVVRWVQQNREVEIQLGVEFLAKGILPVAVTRANHIVNDNIGIADEGIIIACKVKNKLMQTILLPAYLYQSGDTITATQNEQSRQLKLVQSLQNNGLFSHFSLAQV
ncbi:MAG: hypothetical protein V3U65_11675 [Granulosicoccaceae bacterium]